MPNPIDFNPDPATLAVVKGVFEIYRRRGLSDLEVRRRVLADLREAVPDEAFDDGQLEAMVAQWQRAVYGERGEGHDG